MQTKLKQRSALWNREYETREIDIHGDAVDVNHFATEQEAVKCAHRLITAGSAAATVEYHVTRYASARSDRHESYREIAAFGNRGALESFGWEGIVHDR
jgi:hypothetical protein